MTTANALGFFLLGLLMVFLPSMVPGWFPPTGVLGSSTSALWLELMGRVNDAIGAWFLIRNELAPAAARALAWRPEPLAEFTPAQILRPAIRFGTEGALADTRDRRAAA